MGHQQSSRTLNVWRLSRPGENVHLHLCVCVLHESPARRSRNTYDALGFAAWIGFI